MRARSIVLLVVASSLLTLGVVFGLRWYDDRYSFDAAKWRASGPYRCDDAFRQKMMWDLAEGGYLKAGMTREDVLWLLGPPEYSEVDHGLRLLNWDTGTAGASDCSHFHVWFGPKGQRVVKWSVSSYFE